MAVAINAHKRSRQKGIVVAPQPFERRKVAVVGMNGDEREMGDRSADDEADRCHAPCRMINGKYTKSRHNRRRR